MVIDLTFLNHTELRPDCNSHIIQRRDDTPLSSFRYGNAPKGMAVLRTSGKTSQLSCTIKYGAIPSKT
ncbi:hypothetical protein KC345_g29 [Hortaea werneckii]|nr:hypothetical protein KC345_g29 [Hortaea werneckii]